MKMKDRAIAAEEAQNVLFAQEAAWVAWNKLDKFMEKHDLSTEARSQLHTTVSRIVEEELKLEKVWHDQTKV